MSVEVKPGRWRMRCGEVAIVVDRDGPFAWPWRGYTEQSRRVMRWASNGRWHPVVGPFDLIEYLGPEEPTGGTS